LFKNISFDNSKCVVKNKTKEMRSLLSLFKTERLNQPEQFVINCKEMDY